MKTSMGIYVKNISYMDEPKKIFFTERKRHMRVKYCIYIYKYKYINGGVIVYRYIQEKYDLK
jgi:hypothetical protein